MVWIVLVWQENQKLRNSKLFCYKIIYTLSISFLSLLLPLSFIVLTRLRRAEYVISIGRMTGPNTFVSSLFLHTNPNLIHALVLVVSLASFVDALTRSSRVSLIPIYRPPLHVAWIFLCTLQLCIGLGIKATTQVRANGPGPGPGPIVAHQNFMVISKLFFFVGLHETMIHWGRTIVRPIVDHTVYGAPREERWPERWAVAACFWLLSWWRLREEVVLLVLDLIGLFLYYLTVAIGLSRLLKGVIWFWIKFSSRRIVDDDDQDFHHLQLQHKV